MRSVIIIGVAIILCIFILTAGTHAKEDRECIRYAPPTATPIPPIKIYSEWIPMPGTSPRTGHGWIDAREIKTMRGHIEFYQMQSMLQLNGSMECLSLWEVRWGMDFHLE